MLKKISLILSFVLVLVFFAGCAVEERLDRVEDRAESLVEHQEEKLDRVEDRAESLVEHQEEKVEQYLESVAGTPQTTLAEESVTKEQAENIALEYAGLTREQVTGLRTEYEIDDGIPQYNIEFRQDGWEYEFEIHEKTGKILSYDKD